MIATLEIWKIVVGIILTAGFVSVIAAILNDLLTEYHPLTTVGIPPPPKQINNEKRIMNLNELRDEAYRIACEHGWHDEEHSDVHCLMLIVTELSEAVEADRKNRHAAIEAFKADMDFALHEMKLDGKRLDDYMKGKFELYIKDSVEDELADVVIRCLDLAGLRNIGLSELPCEPPQIVSSIIDQEAFTEVMFSFVGMVTDCISSEGFLRTRQFKLFLFYVLELCEAKGIGIKWYVIQKMRYNSMRPYKHGKKY